MRRNKAEKRQVIPDSKYNSEVLARLINMIMIDGKKSTAEKIVYKAMEVVGNKLKDVDAIEAFFQALDNAKPQVQVKSRRVGGATYQVPVEVPQERQAALGMRWMVTYSRNKKGKAMYLNLANEIIDAYNNTGSSVKKKDDTHKMAQANKAFAHYRW